MNLRHTSQNIHTLVHNLQANKHMSFYMLASKHTIKRLLRYFTQDQHCQSAGGTKGLRESPDSLELVIGHYKSSVTKLYSTNLTAIHLTIVTIFHSGPQMSTSWWHKRKSHRRPKPVGSVLWGQCTTVQMLEFHGNQSSSC